MSTITQSGYAREVMTHLLLGLVPPAGQADCLECLDRIQARNEAGTTAAELLRDALITSAVYSLDRGDVDGILQSDPPELPELPPLPFPRVAVEFRENGRPKSFAKLTDADGPWVSETKHRGTNVLDALLVCLLEVTPGKEWRVVIPVAEYDPTSMDGMTTEATLMPLPFIVRPDGAEPIGLRQDDLDDLENESYAFVRALASDWARRHAVLLAHIITARTVPVEAVSLPRGQRRAYKRDHGRDPVVYDVFLNRSGGDSEPGDGSRVYTCRWLVRGHWRQLGSDRRTWVHPYVKGPVGAPWKGRQVRVG